MANRLDDVLLDLFVTARRRGLTTVELLPAARVLHRWGRLDSEAQPTRSPFDGDLVATANEVLGR
jgi:hypothetical protein